MTGTLFLVPNTLDLGNEAQALQAVLPQSVMEQAARLRWWVAEDAKSTRAFLKRVNAVCALGCPLQEMQILEMPRAQTKAGGQGAGSQAWLTPMVQALRGGEDVGLISEAGLPAVADPGSTVVAQAHRIGARVMPLSGPSSLMLALAASGLNGQSFAFVGYLPQDGAARAGRIRELQQRSQREAQTQLLIETPYRNAAVMQGLLEHLNPDTRLSVACGLSLPQGWCHTRSVGDWRQAPPRFEKGLPAVFCFLA